MTTVAYHSDWRERQWTCPCGWTGTGAEAAQEAFAELLQVDCPACEARLCLVPFPTEEETRAAAAQGNAEAIRAVEGMAEREEWEKRLRRTRLYRTDKLPALKGVDRIDLELGMDEHPGGDAVFTLAANGELIHSEVAEWESTAPLPRLLRHAQKRYGGRIASFRVSIGAFMYLAGDSLALGREVDAILERAGFDPEGRRLGDAGELPPDVVLHVCVDGAEVVHREGVDDALIAREVARIHADGTDAGISFAVAWHAGDEAAFVQVALVEGRAFQAEIHDPATGAGHCLVRRGVAPDEAVRIIRDWLTGLGAAGAGWEPERWADRPEAQG